MGTIWAFIFKGEGNNSEIDKIVMDHSTNHDRLLVYGCETVEEGCKVAKRIVEEEGCTLIELCGGFGAEGAKEVIRAVEGKVTVGYIDYFAKDELQKILGKA